MTETICRTLRDGAFGGEHAPALTIRDTLQVPFGFKAFDHFLCSLVHNISLEKSQARGLVLVVLERSPVFYFDMLKSRGFDAASLNNWLRILDLYSDPLGWKDRLPNVQISEMVLTTFKDVGDMEKLFTTIVDVGKGMVGQSKVRFSLAIDSVFPPFSMSFFFQLHSGDCGVYLVKIKYYYVSQVVISAVLRHASVPSMSGLLSNLRSHDQVSSTFWLIHSDLHETRATLALEYISSMIASLDPMTPLGDRQLRPAGSMSSLGEISQSGKCNVRLKRRNGRVKVLVEEFRIEQSGIKFVPIVDENIMINQNLLPKVQFNLELTEKERVDRARVVLPFEHQGNGKTVQIYDGRRSLPEGQTDPHLVRQIEDTSKLTRETNSGKGEIHYLRDSEDEQPDSDEDPDDDLDI